MALFLDPNNQGGGGIKQLESDEGSGVYLKSDNGQGYISFKDQTINTDNEVKLSEFALKSELSNTDLSNYNGELNLTTISTYNIEGTAYTSTSEISAFSTNDIFLSNIPDEYKDLYGQMYKGLYLCDSLSIEDVSVQTFLTLASGGHPGLYSTNGTALYSICFDSSPTVRYVNDLTKPDYDYAEVNVRQIMSGNYGVTIEAKGSPTSAGEAGYAEIVVCSYGSGDEIAFYQASINNGQKITLESILNRIVALESKVTELETALANKANVNSPSFTGKVTINPIME